MQNKTIVWFRKDLRLTDNPALDYAARKGQIIPIYILDEQEEQGEASNWWLHHSLSALAKDLYKKGHTLHAFKGFQIQNILSEIIAKTDAQNIVWNRCYEPYVIERDSKIKEHFLKQNIQVQTFNSALLFEPWQIKNQHGEYFKVFTPFWKNCLTHDPGHMFNSIEAFNLCEPFTCKLSDLTIADLRLLPQGVNWAKDMEQTWKTDTNAPEIGETGAINRFENFFNTTMHKYKSHRNFMDESGASSCLSPHLHFGEISPRYIWHKCKSLITELKEGKYTEKQITKHENEYQVKDYTENYIESDIETYIASIECFLSEIGWREFGYHLLYHTPKITFEPIKSEFEKFPWQNDQEADSKALIHLKQWQKGQTGIPIIDASMRHLWATGYISNRARMVVASFLTKNLLIPWQKGANWFLNTLVDADLASNSMGWQWVTGCGVDAAPYFRIFNCVTQAEKFDPHAHYIKQWVPELEKVPIPYIFQPWEASKADLKNWGVELGVTYPSPIVDLAKTRERALNAYTLIKSKN